VLARQDGADGSGRTFFSGMIVTEAEAAGQQA
jgi:hypothetical protein